MEFIFQGFQKMHGRVAISQNVLVRISWYVPHFEGSWITITMQFEFWTGTTLEVPALCVELILGSKVLCALSWNLHSLPFLPLSPQWWKFQIKTGTEPFTQLLSSPLYTICNAYIWVSCRVGEPFFFLNHTQQVAKSQTSHCRCITSNQNES